MPKRRPLWQWGGLFFVCFLLISCRARSPQAPTPCLGSLTIETVPSGAAILLDGAPIGQAPLTISLSPGTHRLRAEREGWEPAEETVTGTCDEVRVTLTLRDRTPPEVSLNPIAAEVSPEEGLKVIATARDASGIRSLALFVDGQLVANTQ
ncbi:MAG: PEGA domain-containing protein, partial [Chloroflexi bacterium]|nr:PEGA domain-containing protein [Chloroflexota bacterium]